MVGGKCHTFLTAVGSPYISLIYDSRSLMCDAILGVNNCENCIFPISLNLPKCLVRFH
jgi:hypothetical protein